MTIPLTDRAHMLVSRGMYGATQNVYCGLNDFEDMSFVVHYLRPDDLFFDVGANVGAYTVLAAAAAGARTYAFEPSPAALGPLRANVALNHIEDRVTVEACAVGRSAGQIFLAVEGTSAMHRVAKTSSSQAATIPMRSLDSYGLRPSVIKIDVEGYEAEVLAGAVEAASHPDLVAILTENSDDSDMYGDGLLSVADFMSRYGFQPMTYDPWLRTLQPKQGKSDNTLFVRDIEKAQQRVRDAATFRVFGWDI